MEIKQLPIRSIALNQEVIERRYVVNKSALLGIIQWKEVLHVDRLGSELRLEVHSEKMPEKVLINGKKFVEYLNNPPVDKSKNA